MARIRLNKKPNEELYWFEPSYKNKSQLKPWHPSKRTLVRRTYPFGFPFRPESEGIYIEDAKSKRFYGLCSLEFIVPVSADSPER